MANYRHKIDKSERSLEIILRFSFSKRVGKKKDISKKKKKMYFAYHHSLTLGYSLIDELMHRLFIISSHWIQNKCKDYVSLETFST